MIKKSVNFIKENGNEKTAVFFDNDGDGISAAAILIKTLKRKFKNFPLIIPRSHGTFVTKNVYEKILKNNIKVFITLDSTVDEDPKYVLKISEKSKILIIDHHQVRKNLNEFKKIIHLNPNLWESKIESSKYVTSKIVYDVCNKITDIKDLIWLVGLGIINDASGKYWKDFLEKIYKMYPYLKKGKDIYSFDSGLGYINHLITSSHYYYKTNRKLGLKACLEASSPKDFLEVKTKSIKKLKKLYDSVEKEIKDTMKNWKEMAEIMEDKKIIFLRLKTKNFIRSPISTKIGMQRPDYTVIVSEEKENKTLISFRRQDKKINCNKLAIKSTEGLENAEGGGHIPAAGAHIFTKDWNKFKKRLMGLL